LRPTECLRQIMSRIDERVLDNKTSPRGSAVLQSE
jgi:hypothetical protein